MIRDRSRRHLWLYQDSYIETITIQFNLTTDKPPTTPIGMHQLVTNKDLADYATTHLYQRKIGLVLYPAIIIRPDIAFIIIKLSSFLSNPFPDYMVAANRCI